ncbi:inner membrane protein YhjD [Rahnella aquatilis]|uniref:Ribonuclease, putative n=1 Tax=Rahnella aquatilis (strain ATCC 33071 / DSM 4594 / JCM 1683 / NBRC 105701 / NCIMB 13365 / CIP 78.65) TaxID=745277 RepID=H2INV7_RAHAC|nr:inner membrane protein YhjD [Rahnella aquatilis]AEX50092.1 ribonuclease, putative [Rahnella aquatilis CIP 78.65 = ATCC 33071]KFD00893.1 inner membrane protein [Rahnella aquatilis CIP 78.65 = ATCC 33071]
MPIISKQAPATQEKPTPLINIKTGNQTVDKNIGRFSRLVEYVQSWGWVAHLLRATERFNDRLGSQFGAAITYFSFLSLIPILMVSFAAVGFVLASNPDLLAELINKIVNSISDPNLANTLKSTVNTAIQQRTAVGLSGLLIALYSGVSWMGNLREAIRAQSRDVWERNPQDQEKIYRRYLRDFISLTGLVLALIITLSLTSIAGAAQKTIVDALGLGGIDWLRPVMTSITLVISIAANYLLFLWIFWMLPRHKPRKKALLRGTLLAAIGFEVIKFVMTMTLPKLATSPSGAAFGSVIGLMAFFYFFARLTLFVAAWIATAKYKDDPRMPDRRQKTAEAQKMATGNDSEYTPDNLIVPDEMHIAEFNSDNERKKQ